MLPALAGGLGYACACGCREALGGTLLHGCIGFLISLSIRVMMFNASCFMKEISRRVLLRVRVDPSDSPAPLKSTDGQV